MTLTSTIEPLLALGMVLALGPVLTACSSPASSALGQTPAGTERSPGARPSSPALVAITSPKNGAKVTGTTVDVQVALEHARIVSATTTNIRPDEGHLHLYVNNVLTSMNYQLNQQLTVHVGTYAIKVEFVAADHAPFNPRVVSPVVVFTVK